MKNQTLVTNKPNPIVRIVAIVLLAIGATSLASATLLIISHLFVPIVAAGVILLLSWWTIRKIHGVSSISISEEIKDATSRGTREAMRLTGKSFRAAVAATKAIREECNH